MTKFFDFLNRFFDSNNNSTAAKAQKQRRGRSCRIEELEGREMLSAAPWTLVDDFSNFSLPTESETIIVNTALPEKADLPINALGDMPTPTTVTFTGDTFTTTRTISVGGEFHLYELNVSAADIVAGRMYAFETNEISIDTAITLFDKDGDVLDYNDDSGANGDYLEWMPTEEGIYYVGIARYSNNYNPMDADSGTGSSTGTYGLTITQGEVVPAASDVGDTRATAASVVFNASGIYTITQMIGDGDHGSRDVDMFKIEVTAQDFAAGKAYEFSLSRPFGGSYLYSYLRLFNDTGSSHVVSSSDSYLFWVPPAEGTYYLGISGNGNSSYNPDTPNTGSWGYTGDYTLTIKQATVTKLTAPAGVSVVANGETGLTVSWEEVPDAANYTIEYATDANFTKNVQTRSASGTSYGITGLTPGTTYYIHVRANGTGNLTLNSDYSAPLSKAPGFAVDKNYPTINKTVSVAKANAINAITLTWTLPAAHKSKTNELRIEVFASNNNVKALGVITLSVGDDGKYTATSVTSHLTSGRLTITNVKVNEDNSITISGLQANKKYTVFAQARDTRSQTASVALKLTASTTKYAAVKITDKKSGDGTVTLSWSDANEKTTTRYFVAVYYDAKCTQSVWYPTFLNADGSDGYDVLSNNYRYNAANVTAKTVTIAGLASQKYTITVTAVTDGDVSTNVAAVAKITIAPNRFDAVKNLNVNAGKAAGTVLLKWDAAPNATSYTIGVYDAKGKSVKWDGDRLNADGSATYDGKATTVMITGLAAQKYTFTVRASKTVTVGTYLDKDGNLILDDGKPRERTAVAYSATAKKVGAPERYDAVKNLKVNAGSALGTVILEWDASSGAKGYHVMVLDSKGEEADFEDYLSADGSKYYDGEATKVMITGLTSQKYTFVVIAYKEVTVGTYLDADGNPQKDGEGNVIPRTDYAYSAIAKKTGSPARFDSVKGLKVRDAKTNSVRLLWNESSNADLYYIRVYDVKEKEFVRSTETPNTAITITGLDSGTKYQFFVSARKNSVKVGTSTSGEDMLSEAWSSAAKANGSTKKENKFSFTVNVTNVGNSAYTLNWGSDSNVSTYYIYVVVGKEKTYLDSVSGSSYADRLITYNYTNSDLKPGTKYSFLILGYYGGNLIAENKISVTTEKLS